MKTIDLSKAETWWQVGIGNKIPESVTILSSTEKTVVKYFHHSKDYCRIRKDDKYYNFFKTEAEALDFMIARAKGELEDLKRKTNAQNSELHKLQKLKRLL